MKILIKAYQETYSTLTKRAQSLPDNIIHVAPYWNFMLRDIFTALGHEVKFIGPTAFGNEVVTDHAGYDILIFHELESFIWDTEYSLKLLREFKGKKCFYIPTVYFENKEVMDQFDYLFPADAPQYLPYWQERFPTKKIHLLPWHAPEREITLKDTADFKLEPEGEFKLIYTGILIDKYLDMLVKLAEAGETVYIGAIYHKTGEKSIRAMSADEVKSLPPKIKLLSDNGMFCFGDQFKYLRHADLGLVFYPIDGIGCLKHKLVEYLVCGLPSVVEAPTPNGFRVNEINAGQIFKFNDFEDLYRIVQEEKRLKRDRQEIERKAWELFDPVRVCQAMLKAMEN